MRRRHNRLVVRPRDRGRRRGGRRQLPRLARPRADDLDADRCSWSRCGCSSKFAFPRIQEALDKRARRRSANRSTTRSSTREEADELLAEYRERLKEAREQADDIVARARKAAEAAEAEATAEGRAQARGAGRRGPPRHRGGDAALARGDPQGGRRPDRSRDREGRPASRSPPTTRSGSSRRRSARSTSAPWPVRKRGRRTSHGRDRPRLREALFDVAKEHGKLDEVREQLGEFADAVDGRSRSADLLLQPVLLVRREARGHPEARSRTPTRTSSTSSSCSIEKHRMPALFRIRKRFDELWGSENKRLAGDRDQRGRARPVGRSSRSAPRSSARPAQTVELDERRSTPTIIGGIVLQVGNMVLDASIRNRLEKLRQEQVA